jgi:hypothetical protein
VPDNSVANTTQQTLNPAADLALGVIALVLAFVLSSTLVTNAAEHRRERRAAKPDKGPPRWQRELRKGSARTTFVLGAMLTLPGASYLAGLHEIHKHNFSTAVSVLLVIGFNIVMLALLEIPLACFLIAPEWTPDAIERAKGWIGRRGRRLAVEGLRVIGALLILKGVLGLV